MTATLSGDLKGKPRASGQRNLFGGERAMKEEKKPFSMTLTCSEDRAEPKIVKQVSHKTEKLGRKRHPPRRDRVASVVLRMLRS